MHPRILCRLFSVAVVCLAASQPAGAVLLRCPADSVRVGDACIDKYEASIWQIPAANLALVRTVQLGRVTLAELTNGGATQVSPADSCSPSFPKTFDASGNWISPLFAVSVAGMEPTGCVTWFQAEQACALSGKRLLTNQEWQRAAAGTPDLNTDDGATDCNIGGLQRPTNTGSRANCVSNWGTVDMVGNVDEWVADWIAQPTMCAGWGAFSADRMCLSGASTTATGPGALIRGGSFNGDGVGGSFNGLFFEAGVFAVSGVNPARTGDSIGFRCGRSTISTPTTTSLSPLSAN